MKWLFFTFSTERSNESKHRMGRLYTTQRFALQPYL